MAQHFPGAFTVGRAGNISRMDVSEYDNDPRGILWMWELPNPAANYRLGCDPSHGLTGWNRYARTKEDRKTNNGAIEVFRFSGETAYQVAEFASPNDAFEIGYIINVIGRLFAGREQDQCECILETYPGPGSMTLRQLVECGYTNLWKWARYADLQPGQTDTVGWSASNKSNRDLWTKASREIILGKVTVRSPFLVEEYADARFNVQKGYAENPNNNKGHGDRVRAANMALWAGFGWSMGVERTAEPVSDSREVNWAATDASYDQIMDEWSSTVDRLYGGSW